MVVKGQLAVVSSSLSPCEPWGWNLSGQVWQQVPLSEEPFHQSDLIMIILPNTEAEAMVSCMGGKHSCIELRLYLVPPTLLLRGGGGEWQNIHILTTGVLLFYLFLKDSLMFFNGFMAGTS